MGLGFEKVCSSFLNFSPATVAADIVTFHEDARIGCVMIATIRRKCGARLARTAEIRERNVVQKFD